MTALMNRTALDNPLTGRPDGERPDQPAVPEDGHPVREAERIAVAVGCTFPGPCEVVPHDLRRPDSAIRIIENNLSGRQVGDSATELSLRRIAGPDHPGVIQNYSNQFPDGRPPKSTSIGIKAPKDVTSRPCARTWTSTRCPLLALTLADLVVMDSEQQGGAPEAPRDRSGRELRPVSAPSRRSASVPRVASTTARNTGRYVG